jgi:two-component system KDP operon response regulator KdpE
MKQGFKVTTAANTQETLAILAQTPVDLAVLDIGLGDEDGLKLLAQIKARYPAVRAVMLTGMGFVEDLLQEALQKGADGYVSKVLPLEELLMAIHRIFKSSKAISEKPATIAGSRELSGKNLPPARCRYAAQQCRK